MKCDEGLAQILETQVLKISFRLSLEPILHYRYLRSLFLMHDSSDCDSSNP